MSGNVITNVKTAGIQLSGGTGSTLDGNYITLSNALPTAALSPVHILNDGALQTIITSNQFNTGWRAFTTGTRTNGLTNTILTNNRFLQQSGAAIAAGGAGMLVSGNYFNTNGLGSWPGTALVRRMQAAPPLPQPRLPARW